MQKANIYKISSILSLGIVLLSYNQCMSPSGSGAKAKVVSKEITSAAVLNTSTTAMTSLKAFTQTVYPLTRSHCVACHGASQTPKHASSDVNEAFNAVINNSKVDLSNPANSRLVLKLKNENHNCWGNCADNSSEMEAQVLKWKSLISGTTADVTSAAITGKTSKESLTIKAELNSEDSDIVTLMTEAASLKSPMVLAKEGEISYVTSPSGVKDLNSTTAGSATINFSVPTSESYRVFMYVNAPNDSSDSLYTKVVGFDYKDWFIGKTSGYEWREVTNTASKTKTEFYLQSDRSYSLEIRQKEPGVKVSKVLLTSDVDYTPGGTQGALQKATISISIADISGVSDAYFDIDIEEFDLYSYKVSNPRIRSSKDLKVKQLKILVNGSFNSQHATYLPVNKTITKADPILSPYGMILLKDKGSEYDKLSFNFETIEAVK